MRIEARLFMLIDCQQQNWTVVHEYVEPGVSEKGRR